jgi:hypothetical protein
MPLSEKGEYMEQVIVAPDEEWVTYIAKMWLLGSQISQDVTGDKMDGSLFDLDRLQEIINSNTIPASNTLELQSLGIIFGKVLVNEIPNYDWWVVEDEHGKDVCIRYSNTTLLAFPQTMISKRIEKGEKVDVSTLFYGIREDLERIKKENYSKE